jgi:hypothetical protein
VKLGFHIRDILDKDSKEMWAEQSIKNLSITMLKLCVPELYISYDELPDLEPDKEKLKFCGALQILIDLFIEHVLFQKAFCKLRN